MSRTDALAALIHLHDRQRRLRTAYTIARYGWPETLAAEWRRHPGRFQPGEPACRVTPVLEALSGTDSLDLRG
jgi:hypothetical protein